MKEIIDQLTELKHTLKRNKALYEVKVKINKPLKAMYYNMLLSEKITIDDRILEFYRLTNGFHLSWKLKSDYEKVITGKLPFVGGEINIVPFEETFIYSWQGKLWHDEANGSSDLDKQYNLFSRNLVGFDTTPNTLHNTIITAFYFDKKSSKGKLITDFQKYFWNTKGIKFKVNLSFEEYLKKALETRGAFYWQLFYLDFDNMNFSDAFVKEKLVPYLYTELPKMRTFLEVMPEIFPDTDYVKYKNALVAFEHKADNLGFNLK